MTISDLQKKRKRGGGMDGQERKGEGGSEIQRIIRKKEGKKEIR